jgi:hypothetical protein
MGDKEYHGAVNIGATMKARYNAWQHRVSAGVAAGLHGSGVHHGIGKRFREWFCGPVGQGSPVRVYQDARELCVRAALACLSQTKLGKSACATALIVPWHGGGTLKLLVMERVCCCLQGW